MKRALVLFLVLTISMMFYGCGNTKVIDGIEYDTYGLFNKDDNKNPDIHYRVIIGNIVWSAILVETVIAPVYFLGFSLYEPCSKKNPKNIKGAI